LVSGELVGVGLREWLEQHYIKRLERVCKGLTLRVVARNDFR
jgi:hypothetical protein